MIIPAFKAHIHTYTLCETKAAFLTSCMVILKKKKKSEGCELKLQLKNNLQQLQNWFSSVLAFRWTCANMSGLLVSTAISLDCISDSLALKGQNNLLHSPVPGLCYYRTWKLYVVFWEWFWNNCLRSCGTMTGLPQDCAKLNAFLGFLLVWMVFDLFTQLVFISPNWWFWNSQGFGFCFGFF